METLSTNEAAAQVGELLYYRPQVTISEPDHVFYIGAYRFAYCGPDRLTSLGAIRYEHLLMVLDEHARDVLYVTAEMNILQGESIVYLGRFSVRQHATITNSSALKDLAFFLPVATMVARKALHLSYAQYPLTEAEDMCLARIPQRMSHVFADGNVDGETQALLEQLAVGVLASPPSAAGSAS